MENEKIGVFGFEIRKKNAKPDAPKYKLETMNDLYQIVTVENVDRVFKDLKQAFTIIAMQKEVLEEIEKGSAKQITMPYIEWIDD